MSDIVPSADFLQRILNTLKVPKREIFDRSDFPDFYTIQSSWICDLLVKILTFYFTAPVPYAYAQHGLEGPL